MKRWRDHWWHCGYMADGRPFWIRRVAATADEPARSVVMVRDYATYPRRWDFFRGITVIETGYTPQLAAKRGRPLILLKIMRDIIVVAWRRHRRPRPSKALRRLAKRG